MNVGVFCLAAAASIVPLFGCQLSAAEQQAYGKATSSNLPLSERRNAFEQSIHACPEDVQMYTELASLLVANRDFANALSWIDKGLAHAPEDATLNLRKGEALVGLGQGKEALQALSKTPLTGESQLFRGLASQLIENHRAARDCFFDAWKRGNEDPYVLYSLIREDRNIGDKTAGLDHFEIMLARFPNSAWIHILLGDASFQIGREEDAKKEYLAAVQLAPDLFEPNFRLAYIAFEAGEYTSAEQYYRRALAAKPHHTEANVYLGEALRREGRIPEAAEQLRHAIEVDPEAMLAYDSLAKSLSDAGRLQEAADVLFTAENKFPDDSSFPAVRARLLNRLGRTKEAGQEANRATQIIAKKNREALIHQ